MTSGEKAEPERSAISSTDCRHCLTHPLPGPHTDGKCCLCGITREVLDGPKKCGYGEHDFKPFQGYRDEPGEPHCLTCGHTQGECAQHLAEKPEPSTECEGGCRVYSAPPCRDPAKCSCGGEWWKHGCKHSLPPEPCCEGCGHPGHSGECRELEMPGTPGDVDECGCLDDREPPLTPEEHNLGPEGVDCVFDACPRDPDDCDNGCRTAADELSREGGGLPPSEGPGYTVCVCGDPKAQHSEALFRHCMEDACGCLRYRPRGEEPSPPQPDRRPPYLLAYSVQGHLYEVALPGDATVQAIDGALIITHHLAPVTGVCRVAPITNEESTR